MTPSTPSPPTATRRAVSAAEAQRDTGRPRGPARLARTASVALVVIGVLVRLWQYGSGRSLWLDESFLWLNLDRLSARELTGPLELAQGAPIPFLLAEKGMMTALGDAEWTLRLLPLLFGVGALVLGHRLAVRLLPRGRVWLAVAPLALGQAPIFYSTELKQYSLDMLVATALLLLLVWAAAAPMTWCNATALGASGAAAVWLSDPAVFILAGGGAALLLAAAIRREDARVAALAGVAAAWLVSFAAVYAVHVRDLAAVRALATAGTGAGSADALAETVRRLPAMLSFPIGGSMLVKPLTHALIVLGMVALWRCGRRTEAGIIGLPMIALLAAVLIGQYPLGGRFALFLAPAIAIAFAAGAGAAWDLARRRGRVVAAAVATAALVAAAPYAARLAEPRIATEELGTVADAIGARIAPGDAIYLYYASQFAFAYYGPRAGVGFAPRAIDAPDPGDASGDAWGDYSPVLDSGPGRIVGRASTVGARLARDVERVRAYRRVWLVFSHVRVTDGVDESELILERARTFARQVAVVRAPGAFAVLMERR